MPANITTQRFLLQQIIPDDQGFIFEGLSHPLVVPYYGVRYSTFEATKEQMDYYRKLGREGTGHWWKIVDRQTAQKMGAIGYNNYIAAHQKAEIGYWLLPAYWRRGIMAEAIPALLEYLFKVKGLHRVEAMIETGNAASARTAESAGFKYEGTLRDCELKNGQFISLLLYSKLATD